MSFLYYSFLWCIFASCSTEVTLGAGIIFLKQFYRMYTVIKRMEISAAHSLSLSYPSKCEYLHGHNWIITVLLAVPVTLNSEGWW